MPWRSSAMFFCKCQTRWMALLVASCFPSVAALALSPPDAARPVSLTFNLAGTHRYLATDEILTSLPAPAVVGVDQIVSFEDHEYFAYIFGTSPTYLRRVIYLRPGLVVIDDQVDAHSLKTFDWKFVAHGRIETVDGGVRTDADGVYF